MKNYQKYFLISTFVIAIDQFVKLLVKFNLQYDEEIAIIRSSKPCFKIHFLENKGAAFGVTVADLFNQVGLNMSPETGKLILSLFSIVAVSVIGVVLYRVSEQKSLLPLFVAFIFGGAIGNIIDRVFYGIWFASINNYEGGFLHGRVVDMFYLDFWEGYLFDTYLSFWPVFNIADAAISIGIVAILVFQKHFFNTQEEKSTREVSPISPVESVKEEIETVAPQE